MKNRVGFGPRAGAFLIDAFLIAFLSSLLMSILMEDLFSAFIRGDLTAAVLNRAAGTADSPATDAASIEGFYRVSSFLANFSMLYMLLEAFFGATPGKMLLGLKIGTEEGKAGDTWLYFYRYGVKNSPSLLGLLGRTTGINVFDTLGGVAGLVIFFGCFLVLGIKKQAVHDIIARTAVFRKNQFRYTNPTTGW